VCPNRTRKDDMKALITVLAYLVYKVLDLFPDPRAFTSLADLKQVNWNYRKEQYGNAR
jgi:hypothetical protein